MGVGLVVGVGLLIFGSHGGDSPQPLNPQSGGNTAPVSAGLLENLRELESNAVVLGDVNAPVTLIEFGDYQCTFCTKFFFETKPSIEKNYVESGKLKMIFVDNAINGRESVNAAEASWCANDQGRYWDYHNKLYQERKGYSVGAFKKDKLVQYAGDLGLNQEEFEGCYEARKYKDKVAASTRSAPLFGARGTPSFLLNGKVISGAQPYSVFEQLIEAELSKIN